MLLSVAFATDQCKRDVTDTIANVIEGSIANATNINGMQCVVMQMGFSGNSDL